MAESKISTVTHTLRQDDIPLATNGLTAPIIYADSIRGAMLSPEVAKFNLVQNLVDAQTNEIMSVHVATIVLPASQMEAWGKWLIGVANGRAPNANQEVRDGSI